jgi:hypothetical protein
MNEFEKLDQLKISTNNGTDYDSVLKSDEEILMERVSEILGGPMVDILLDLVN